MFISKVNQLAEKLTKGSEVPATGTLRPDLEGKQHPCNSESHTQGPAQALLERASAHKFTYLASGILKMWKGVGLPGAQSP